MVARCRAFSKSVALIQLSLVFNLGYYG